MPLLLAAMFAGLFASTAVAADDVALARDFWVLHAIKGGYAEPAGDQLATIAANLVTYCAETPAAQMPRLKLQTCEEFDDYKRANERWDRFRALRDR